MKKILLICGFISVAVLSLSSCMMMHTPMMQHGSHDGTQPTRIIKEIVNDDVTISLESQLASIDKPSFFTLKVYDSNSKIELQDVQATLLIEIKQDHTKEHSEKESDFKPVELMPISAENGIFKFNYSFTKVGLYEIRAEVLMQNPKKIHSLLLTHDIQETNKSSEDSSSTSAYTLLGVLGAAGMGIMMGAMMLVFIL